MKSSNSRPAPCHSSASAPRFASFSTWSGNGGAPIRSPSSSGTSTPVQPRFGATSRRPALSTRPGERDRGAGGQRGPAPRVRRARRRRAARGRRARRRPGGRGCRPSRARGGARRRPGRRRARRGSRRRSPARGPTTPCPLSSTGSAGPADRAAQLDLGLAHQAEVDQLADEARDRRLVQPGLLGDRGARARTLVGDVAQHHAEVVPPHGALVGRSVARVVRGHGADPNGSGAARDRCPRANAQARWPPSSCASRARPRRAPAAAVTSSSVSACASQPARASRSSATSAATSAETSSRCGGRPSGSPSSSRIAGTSRSGRAPRSRAPSTTMRDRLAVLQRAAGRGGRGRGSGRSGAPRRVVLPHPGRFHAATSVECIGAGAVRRASRARSSHRVAGAPRLAPCPCHTPACSCGGCGARARGTPPRSSSRSPLGLGAWPELPARLRRRAARLAGRAPDLLRRVGLARGDRRRGAPLEPLRRARAAATRAPTARARTSCSSPTAGTCATRCGPRCLGLSSSIGRPRERPRHRDARPGHHRAADAR